MVLAATTVLLPDDVSYLGMDASQLCLADGCRIVKFLSHDRVAFGSGMAAVGILYTWVVAVPLRRGAAWAWWAMLLSATVGFGSFMTFVWYGYFDVWHGITSVALAIVFAVGLTLTYRGLQSPKGIRCLLRLGMRASIRTPAGFGRALLLAGSLGGMGTGLTILLIGLTIVFVPQDLGFFHETAATIHSVSPRLVPLIVHDRVEFGAGTAAAGMVAAIATWSGLTRGSRGLWCAFLLATLVGYVANVAVHWVVGYRDLVHLLPVYLGFAVNLVSLVLLYGTTWRSRGRERAP
jgi:hypothetical protein